MKKRTVSSWPESSHEYKEGCYARTLKKPRDLCPYGHCQLEVRSRWLAGWNDTDISLSKHH